MNSVETVVRYIENKTDHRVYTTFIYKERITLYAFTGVLQRSGSASLLHWPPMKCGLRSRLSAYMMCLLVGHLNVTIGITFVRTVNPPSIKVLRKTVVHTTFSVSWVARGWQRGQMFPLFLGLSC